MRGQWLADLTWQDAASGSDVRARMVARYARAANAVDLDALWASLGLKLTDGRLTVDDAAPLAHVRRAIVHATATELP